MGSFIISNDNIIIVGGHKELENNYGNKIHETCLLESSSNLRRGRGSVLFQTSVGSWTLTLEYTLSQRRLLQFPDRYRSSTYWTHRGCRSLFTGNVLVSPLL